MKRFVLTPSVEADLVAITDYYLFDRQSPYAAKTVLRELRTAFRALVKNPHLGHSRTDLTSKPYLFWPVRSYLIVYRPETKPLEVVAVLHAKRDLPPHLDRR
jgi:antitoxin ParD1/3/4/toxin ParE1/3/4